MKNLDVVQILRLGAIGLGFLLALMSYRLLAKEQATRVPRAEILGAIRTYMGFALVLVVLAIVGEIAKFAIGNSHPPEKFDFGTYSADMRRQYEHSATPDAFARGDLMELGEGKLTIELPGGKCEGFLAVVPPTNASELHWWTDGPGARDVKFEYSGTDNVQTGSICTPDDPKKSAEVGLSLKMTRGAGKYSLETYFISQRVFDGK